MPAKIKVKSQKLKVKSKIKKTEKKVAVKETLAKNKKVEARVSVASSKISLSASVYDVKGKSVGRISLPPEIFGLPENKQLLSQAVRVYLANQRLGTHSTKTRGEVQGSTRKIYKQKGTGRARHGGIRAPIFVHGGIAHGPNPVDYSLSFPQKMKKKALFVALSEKLKDGEIRVMDLSKIQPKTKIMAKALEVMEMGEKILLVTPGGFKDFENVYKASRNLKRMRISPANSLNTYDVLDNNAVIFMKDSIDSLKKHFLKNK